MRNLSSQNRNRILQDRQGQDRGLLRKVAGMKSSVLMSLVRRDTKAPCRVAPSRKVCRPDIGLHTVGGGSVEELRQVPWTQWVTLQTCYACEVTLGEVSKNGGVLLADGTHVLCHWRWALKLVLEPTEADRLDRMPVDEALTHVIVDIWDAPRFRDPPNMSMHPSVIRGRPGGVVA